MRNFAIVFCLALAGICQAVQAEGIKVPDPKPSPDLEQCIRDGVPQVEAAIPDLMQGVDFLVSRLCTIAVARQQVAQHEFAFAAKKSCPASQDTTTTVSKDRDGKPVVSTITNCGAVEASELTVAFYGDNGPKLAAQVLAARLLLDLRNSRKKAGH